MSTAGPDLNAAATLNGQGVHAVHARLRTAILRGQLEAGEVLSQVQLAEQYGVSRTPLREALRLLEREGLMLSEARRRVRVAPFSLEDLEQVYAMRIGLETLGIRLTIPNLDEPARTHLADLERTVRGHADNQDYESWHEPHQEFHRALVAAAGPRILGQSDVLADHAERYRYCTTTMAAQSWENGTREHKTLLDAALRGDTGEAVRTLARHYARVALSAAALIDPEHDPRAIREALRLVLEAP